MHTGVIDSYKVSFCFSDRGEFNSPLKLPVKLERKIITFFAADHLAVDFIISITFLTA